MWWPVSVPMPSLRRRRLDRPVASTTQRAETYASMLVAQRHPVLLRAQLDVLHPPAAERIGAALQRAVEQRVLEHSPIDLMRVDASGRSAVCRTRPAA